MTAIDDLRAVYERFKAMPPIAVAFWCVDSPTAVWQMRSLVQSVQDVSPSSSITPLTFTGIPVHEWYSRFADDEDRAKRPACFSTPGVYAEMNDGTWRGV